jgi:hypothetical protein
MLCIIKRCHEDCYESRDIGPHILSLGISIEMSDKLHTQANLPQPPYPVNQKLGGSLSRCEFSEEKISLRCWDFHTNFKKPTHTMFTILIELFIKQYNLQYNFTYPDSGVPGSPIVCIGLVVRVNLSRILQNILALKLPVIWSSTVQCCGF